MLSMKKQNILSNYKLNQLFNFSEVDWMKAEKFALSNLVKTVCKLKKSNPSLNVMEIAKSVNISISSVKNYLNRGKKYGFV